MQSIHHIALLLQTGMAPEAVEQVLVAEELVQVRRKAFTRIQRAIDLLDDDREYIKEQMKVADAVRRRI